LKKKTGFQLKDLEIEKLAHLYKIKHLKSYKHKKFLPINGQRNCTNGATAKKQSKKAKSLIYKLIKKSEKNK